MGLKKKFKGNQIKTKLVSNSSMFSKQMIYFEKSIYCTILPAEKKIQFLNSLVEDLKKREYDTMKMKVKISEEERKHSR